MGAPDPHSAYDRRMARQRRWEERLRRLGRIVFYLIALVLTVGIAVLLVVAVIDLRQPRIWGTFTQTDCEPRPRGGCRPVGTWVSDDGGIIKGDIYLDGWTDGAGITRASYQPDAIISDESNNVVHASELTGAGPWTMGLFLIGWVGYVLYQAAAWGDVPMLSRRRHRPVSSAAEPLTRGSLRRNRRRSRARCP